MDQTASITDQRTTTTICWRIGSSLLVALALLAIGLWNLSSPPLWWDEGWTLSVARNWVERGHYGRLLGGDLAPPGLEAAFPVTASVALSFRLFGIGIWQGRLVGVLFMAAALFLMYYLASRLYNRQVAVGTLFVLLFMSMHPDLHPLINGRQVLAELPMFFYLLGGYTCFLFVLHGSLWFMPVAVTFWGVALITKAQVLPFWTISLLVPLVITLYERKWNIAAFLTTALLGSFILCRLLIVMQQILLRNHTLPRTQVHGMYDITALVPALFNRLYAVKITLIFGVPTLLGLGYAAWRLIKDEHPEPSTDIKTVRLALLALTGSWFAWYLALSVGVPRYLFPVTFFGSMFVAALLYDLTDHFSLSSTIKRGGHALRTRHFTLQSTVALLTTLAVAWSVRINLVTLYRYYAIYADTSALRVADFLNTQTSTKSLVETYDSELFFLVDRRFHYPPDQLHVELNRRSLLGRDVTVGYDPLAKDPDYLVVGPFGRLWHLYDPVLAKGVFRLLRSYNNSYYNINYDIYERVR